MKYILLAIISCLCTQHLYAQKDTIRTVSMEEVVIKAEAVRTGKMEKRVRSKLMYWVIDTPLSKYKKLPEYYLVTKFPPVDTVPVRIHSAELRLKPYDSSIFSMNFVIFSICNGDTLFKKINLDKYSIHRNKLVVNLQEEGIVLCSNTFYMGYGKRVKSVHKTTRYRMICTDKGEGAIITVKDGTCLLHENISDPFIFPFKLSYKVY